MKKLSPEDPRSPADYTKRIAYALKAIAAGEANEEQQRIALRWIINDLCGTYDLSFRADPNMTAFAEGKRSVGLAIVKLLNLTGTALDQIKD